MSMLGITIGPYRLEDVLGEGGMGRVYRAWDRRLERYVAVKHVRPEVAKSDLHRARFKREAWAVARLNHPSIVHIYDILENDAGDWIVMELVGGPSLRSMILRGPLAPRYAAAYGRQIAEGLAEAHAKGIVHRDLKTENVLIAPSGQAKILDFGLAKPMVRKADEKTLSMIGAVIGTCRSMSPEQAEGYPVGPASDLFSLGTLLYEVCTGTSPFKDSTSMKTLARVVSYQPKPLYEATPEVPRQLSDLVARLLVKEPERRPASASSVAAELAEIEASHTSSSVGPRGPVESHITLEIGPDALASAELEAPDPKLVPRAKSYRSRRLALWVLIGLILFGLAFFAWQMRSERHGSDQDPAANVELSAFDRDANLDRAERLLAHYDKPGHLDQVIELYQGVLTHEEADPVAHAGLSRAYVYRFFLDENPRWLERAENSAERAVELDGVLAAGRVSLGMVYAGLGKHEEAREEWNQALLLDPQQADAYAGLGTLYLARQNWEEAEKAYRMAADLRPHQLRYLNLLGTLYFRQRRFDEALAVFTNSVEIAPNRALGYRQLAAVHAAQGHLERASETVRKALDVQPQADLLALLGTYLFRQGFYDQAVEVLEQAVELPDGLQDGRIWGQLGDAYRQAIGEDPRTDQAYDRALRWLSNEIEHRPGAVEPLSYRALYLARTDRCEEARQALIDVDALTHAQHAFRLALASETCGDRAQSLRYLEKALTDGQPLSEVEHEIAFDDLRADSAYAELAARFASAEISPKKILS